VKEGNFASTVGIGLREAGRVSPGRGARTSQGKQTMTAKATPFRHEAVFYDGLDDFVAQMSAFIGEAVCAGEPVLVVVGAEKIERLQDVLGTPEGVAFIDMSDVGGNPARIIPVWRDFVDRHAGEGGRFRGIGEPIWAERSAAELVECQRHESLLNVAFADASAFWLVCPYDTTTLPVDVLDEAMRSHEYVSKSCAGELSGTYSGVESFTRPFDAPLADPPPDAATMAVSIDTLQDVRRLVARYAQAAHFDKLRATDLVFVANEIASNSIVHAGGHGVFKIWRDNGSVVCETQDEGRIVHAMVGRERPQGLQVGGLGLWLANQLCDLVQIRTFDDGSVVRAHMSRSA